uniref:Uncharacterized protein n=1 Tax=Romanomermis culicivorax TaxID=13658 RepID=A0A915J2W2_ROMCU
MIDAVSHVCLISYFGEFDFQRAATGINVAPVQSLFNISSCFNIREFDKTLDLTVVPIDYDPRDATYWLTDCRYNILKRAMMKKWIFSKIQSKQAIRVRYMRDFLFLFDQFQLSINEQNILRKKEEKTTMIRQLPFEITNFQPKASFENWRSEVEKGKRFEVLHGGNKTGIMYLYCHRSPKFESRSKGLKAPKISLRNA